MLQDVDRFSFVMLIEKCTNIHDIKLVLLIYFSINLVKAREV